MSIDTLPDGWTRVEFGDVVRKVNDRVDPDTAGIDRYVAGEHMDTDDLTIRRWGEIGDGYLGPAFHMRFRPGQVLYGSRRTYLRKVAVADFEGITANTTFVVEPSSKDLLPEFLPLLMTTEAFHEHSIKQSKGSVNPYINFSDLTWYEFALPPIDEQRRIIEVLAAVDKHASCLAKQVDVGCLARSAVLRELLSAGGHDWTETTLGDVAQWYSGGTPKTGRADFYEGGTIPWVVIADMMETEIFDTASKITDAGLSAIGGRLAPKGSVLISMYATVGRPGYAHLPVATNQAIAWSVPDESVINSRFLLLVAQHLEPKIAYLARGATQRNINRAMLRGFAFSLPPLVEQKRIVDIVSSMDDVIKTTKRAIADAKKLRSGLLSILLAGEKPYVH